MELLLEDLWGLEETSEPESLAEIAKRNQTANALHSIDMWARARLLDTLAEGFDPMARETKAADAAVARLGDTKVTLKALLARAGDKELIRTYREYQEEA
jgi:hypothetical protein